MMTKSGASNRDVKKINRIRTMRSIFDCDRISQPELAAKVGNSWPTVLQNVKELMEMGLVQEVGTFESTGGPQGESLCAGAERPLCGRSGDHTEPYRRSACRFVRRAGAVRAEKASL